MSLVSGHAKSAVATEGFYPQTISQSLRFEDGDVAYLTRAAASKGTATDVDKCTISVWLKRGNLGSLQTFMFAGTLTNNTILQFDSSDKIYFSQEVGGAKVGRVSTAAVFRDPSAWYHIVFAYDSTEAVAVDRAKLWVNGEFVEFTNQTDAIDSGRDNFWFSNTYDSHIGYDINATTNRFDGYMAEYHGIDGTAYTADNFGELKNDIWVPKANIASTLTYGTNGFYLPFAQDTAVEGFNTVTWRGNGSTSHAITGTGFQPDFVWIKNRSGVYDHHVYDSVRGAGERLQTNTTNAESTITTGLNSFDSDGFTLSSDGAVNLNTNSYVAWCWDAGSGSPVSNTDGTITSTVKANTDYGFSIATFTGNGTLGATVGHGLNSAPEVVIVKSRSNANGWAVYHAGVAADAETDYLFLNATDAASDLPGFWNDTAPTSSVVTLGDNVAVNRSAGTHVMYCWHSVSGYSKFGSYTGNGSATGPTVTLGFKPAFVMIKCATPYESNGNWIIYDNTRSPNVSSITQRLYADLSNAEGTNAAYDIEFTDTGFQLKDGTANIGSNTSGTTYVYMAFADKRDAAFWLDESGNNNDWTVNNLVASDVVPDSPTNNFATFNPLHSAGSMTIAEGNLSITAPGNNWYTALVTQGVDSGKWYAEFLWKKTAGYAFIGVAKIAQPQTINAYLGESSIGDSDSYGYYFDGDLYNNSVHPTYGASYTDGDVIGLALDMDAGNLTFYKNGVSQGTAVTGLTGTMYIGATSYSVNSTVLLNCGQDSTFAGQTTAGGNTDANGLGNFKYSVPSGYLALCTSNLPNPTIDPAQEGIAGNNFDVVTYSGNGASQLIGDVVREVPDTVAINQSLRFDHAGSTYLTFDPASDGDLTEWTFSTWFKRTGADARIIFGQGTSGSTNRDIIYLEATGELQVASYGGSYVFQFVTDRIFNDSAAWYHLVVAYDSSQATDTDRVKIWVNGLRITNFSTNTKPSLNASTAHFNSGSPQYIGKYIDQGTYWNGYQAETHWIDGTAYAATDFGAYNADGIWTPITPSVTYGTNGWHINYSAASYSSGTPDTFADQANSNNFSAYGFDSAQDIVPDTPTNQFPVIDSNRKPGHVTLTEGNLNVAVSVAGWETFKSAIGFDTGNWYWEVKVADDGRQFVGVMHDSSDATDIADVYYRTTGLWNVYYNGDMYLNSGFTVNNGNTFGTDDILSIAFDADTGQFWLGENGTWYNSGDPANGTNELFTVPTTDRIFPTGSVYYTASRQRWNFGQDATFAGDDTGSLGPYSDSNSVGEFYYQPPTGFLALAENNITNDTTNVESPDLVWIKNRDQADSHQLFDSVRGATKYLQADGATAELTDVNGVTGFFKNGFTVGNRLQVNTYGEDYVAWTWKGGTQSTVAVGDIDGTNPTIATTLSANTTAGFSIISYLGNGTDGATIAHGLDSPPELCIFKTRDDAVSWLVGGYPYGPSVFSANNQLMNLDLTNAVAAGSSHAFTVGTSYITLDDQGGALGAGPDNIICYAFHSVDGFSKVGSYKGNGNANGSFVYTGFRPKWVMIKDATSDEGGNGNWIIYDVVRSTYNVMDDRLFANLSSAEITNTEYSFDILSNGFKARSGTANRGFNNSGQTYIYLAFAEQPFKYSNAR